jgi:hypothetical protein
MLKIFFAELTQRVCRGFLALVALPYSFGVAEQIRLHFFQKKKRLELQKSCQKKMATRPCSV